MGKKNKGLKNAKSVKIISETDDGVVVEEEKRQSG